MTKICPLSLSLILHIILIVIAVKYNMLSSNNRLPTMFVSVINHDDVVGLKGADNRRQSNQRIKVIKQNQKKDIAKRVGSDDSHAEQSSVLNSRGNSTQSETSETMPWSEYRPVPTYPEIARVRNWQGEVTVVIETDQNGQVHTAKIVKSSGYQVLDNAALEAIAAWRSKPSAKLSVPFVFKLND